jgi:hypothetical protein
VEGSVIHAFLHWLNVELWSPMWPNVFAPNIWTIAAVVLHLLATLAQRARHHREAERRADERHEELKKHVTSTAGGAR